MHAARIHSASDISSEAAALSYCARSSLVSLTVIGVPASPARALRPAGLLRAADLLMPVSYFEMLTLGEVSGSSVIGRCPATALAVLVEADHAFRKRLSAIAFDEPSRLCKPDLEQSAQ